MTHYAHCAGCHAWIDTASETCRSCGRPDPTRVSIWEGLRALLALILWIAVYVYIWSVV